ncbi:MAG: YdbH domain-containing protein [Phenylobacterium sp.]|uniref:intermembrane phospholipid transport protein YdbH family protein n=1 Tax=Phenylobacterium sp. TaxID=1871053 RepID=UPI001A3734E3|nr:YdbH domain-containing protein [Phenylobacterium sp.]MBL8770931.1 YdbH domain-containing protein [Phenylobacterium sp.]
MPDAKPAKTRPLRLVLAVAGVVLVVVAALAWLNRRTLARDALTDWLRSKGVAADAEVEAIGPTTFTARLALGDPRSPDFAAERVEVRYRPRLTGVEVVSVAMRKPVLRARLKDGRLSVGSLDRLVQEVLRRPPRPNAAQPRISIDDGLVVLATDYGQLRLAADALVEDGRLRSLAATAAPARLAGGGFALETGAGVLRASTTASRTDASLSLPIARAAFADRTLTGGRLTVSIRGPYPDLVKRSGEGAVTLRANLTADRLAGGGQTVRAPVLTAAFDGRSRGWIDTLALEGRGVVELAAAGAEAGTARAGAVRARLVSDDLRWLRRGGDRVTGTGRLAARAADVRAAELSLPRLALDGALSFDAASAGLQASMRAGLEGRGRWDGLGPIAAGDTAQVAALKRAARGFTLSTSGLRAELDARSGGGASAPPLRLALATPLRIRPDGGGEVQVTAPDGGVIRIASRGGGLPQAEATVSNLRNGGADVALQAREIAFASLVGGTLQAAGRVQTGAAITFTAARCVAFGGRRLELGANDVESVSGRLCPAGGPMLTMRDGRWSLAGRAEAVSAAVPFLQARVSRGVARVRVDGRGGAMGVRAQVVSAALADTAPETRFNPVTFSGPVSLADFIWTADLDVRRPDGGAIAIARVTHDSRLALGVAVVETPLLQFAEGGLQPVDLSPLAAAVGSPATGSARFQGRFDWAPEGATSTGALSVPRLDFTSPAGPVKGLMGELAFESLAPLRAAPGQELSIEAIEAIVPVTALRAKFALRDDLITIAGGEALVGGGRVRVETLEIPLTPGAPTRGVLFFDGVQLHDLVEASPFGDKVELDAKVSGRVPFERSGNRVRITGGELRAVQPGRISIDRTALTGVQADTAVAAPAAAPVVDPNATFTDFAYQAMENLAFETLEATIASREDGRLGVLFHIVGRHDPPTKQAIRLTLMDLIQRRFLGRKLPLPSGTKVNLTLDTTLNLDDLLDDWAEYQKARQPQGGDR